jgi:hypothetical protein
MLRDGLGEGRKGEGKGGNGQRMGEGGSVGRRGDKEVMKEVLLVRGRNREERKGTLNEGRSVTAGGGSHEKRRWEGREKRPYGVYVRIAEREEHAGRKGK